MMVLIPQCGGRFKGIIRMPRSRSLISRIVLPNGLLILGSFIPCEKDRLKLMEQSMVIKKEILSDGPAPLQIRVLQRHCLSGITPSCRDEGYRS